MASLHITKILRGFTLIELLIVIVIIGILTTSLIPRLKGLQDKAKYARVEKDFKDLQQTILIAQNNTQKNLKEITLTYHTMNHQDDPDLCVANDRNMRYLPSDHPCRTKWIAVLRLIENAALISSGGLSFMETDPRGSPYVLSNGEGHAGNGTAPPCSLTYLNYIQSAGPDGLMNISYFSVRNTSSTDDRKVYYRSIFCPDAY